ncbi:hypothetical protein L7F22_044820 [Adiantum nelumboides]|nr:hypothetical protein [Adiantum nelumboides]
MFEDDEFDFGGDEAEDPKTSAGPYLSHVKVFYYVYTKRIKFCEKEVDNPPSRGGFQELYEKYRNLLWLKDLETAEKKIKELQDDLGAVQFTPHSKNGKMLMAKCRTLQEENEEIGREASEGKIHELGTKLAMQKSLNTELKRGYQELYEYVEEVSEEAERSHELVNILQRQLERKEQMLLELQRQLEMFNNPKVVQEGQNQVETEDIVLEERVEGMETNEPAVKVERAE